MAGNGIWKQAKKGYSTVFCTDGRAKRNGSQRGCTDMVTVEAQKASKYSNNDMQR